MFIFVTIRLYHLHVGRFSSINCDFTFCNEHLYVKWNVLLPEDPVLSICLNNQTKMVLLEQLIIFKLKGKYYTKYSFLLLLLILSNVNVFSLYHLNCYPWTLKFLRMKWITLMFLLKLLKFHCKWQTKIQFFSWEIMLILKLLFDRFTDLLCYLRILCIWVCLCSITYDHIILSIKEIP